MIVETGHYALVLALVLAFAQAVLPLWGSLRRNQTLMGTAVPVALGQFALVAYSFLALTYAHVESDFSVRNVVENSHSAKPLVYKISGVWGNHEGSMLLWVLILALFGALVASLGRNMPRALHASTLAVQGWIACAFLLFIVLTSDPFARISPAPMEGHDLNPLLQDPGLAIHPPLLYLGYVGFSIVFSFAAAALIGGRVDAGWARFVRPWALLSWIALTLGIAMGSYWAYYTLGWGGFWFWDPVENASLMPWLAGTALLHCTAVMEKREALKIWTIFLAVVTFSLSLLGTFLVRSGVLSSVHSFAQDPTRGVFILLILVFFIGGSLALYAWRAPTLTPGGVFAPISREGALVFNNLFLSAACATVLTGTLYPLALEALTGEKISVGAPFFNLTFGPLLIPLLLAMPIGQSLAWKRGDLVGAAQRVTLAAAAGFVVAIVAMAVTRGGPVLAAARCGNRRLHHSRSLVRRRASGTAQGDVLRRHGKPGAWPSAVHLGHRRRARGARGDVARPRGDRVGRRAHRDREAWRNGRPRPLPGHDGRRYASRWPQLQRSRGPHGRSGGGSNRRHRRAGQAVLHHPPNDGRGSRHRYARAGPSLHQPGGLARRRVHRCQDVLETVGGPDLDRRRRHGVRRAAVGVRSPLAHRGGAAAARGADSRSRAAGPGRMKLRAASLVLAVTFASTAGHAVEPGEILSNPVLEQRARAISAGLRCLVCQNQSIDDSQAPLARDLRLIVRQRLQAGDSDSAVRDYLVARYGDFVLLKPPLKSDTLILWAAPFAVLLAGALVLVRRPRADPGARPLSAEEQARVDALIEETKQ